MTEILTRIEWDGSTGETKVIPLTPEEIAQREADAAAFAIEQAARDAEAKAVADAKASAITKLAKLGLSDAEISALTA